MDAEYLKKWVGRPLSEGLAKAALIKPADPIEFLGNWLLQWNKNQQRQEELQAEAEQLRREKAQHEENLEFERLQKIEDERIRAAQERHAREEREDARRSAIYDYDQRRAEKEKVVEASFTSTSKKKEIMAVYRARLENARQSIIAIGHTGFLEDLKATASATSGAEKAYSEKVLQLMRAVFHLVGYPRRRLRTWNSIIRMANKWRRLRRAAELNPLERHSNSRFARAVEMHRQCGTEEEIRKEFSYPMFVLYDWLAIVVAMRKRGLQLKDERLGLPPVEDDVWSNLIKQEEEGNETDEDEKEEELEHYAAVAEEGEDDQQGDETDGTGEGTEGETETD